MPAYELDGRLPWVDPEAFLHPEAVIMGDVRIEAQCFIAAGAVLRGDIGSIVIEKRSNIQENCVVHTFPEEVTRVHAETHVGHGCILHGCEIGSNVLVGMGSVICDGVKIDDNCLIGAASFIPPRMRIPSFSVVMGSPARVVKSISEEQLEEIRSGVILYADIAARCKSSLKDVTEQVLEGRPRPCTAE